MKNKYKTKEFQDLLIETVKHYKSMAAAAAFLKMHYVTFKSYAIKLGVFIPNPSGKGMKKRATRPGFPLEEILAGLHPQYHTHKVKKRLIKEGYKDHMCERCKLTEWLGNPIPVELHHIDGDRTNHKLANLQILCSNCHSLTPNFSKKSG